jgi:hypothetical protein
MGNLYNLMRGMCMYCHRFKMNRTQLWKYIAKLRLLEHGLVEAAQGIDDLTLQVRRAKGKGKEAEDTMDVDEDETSYEKDDEFITRINLFVAIHMQKTKGSRDGYKNEIAYQMRKDLIQDFLRNTMLKKCQNGDCSS